MTLSVAKLEIFWKKREAIFKDSHNKIIVERFERINSLFRKIKELNYQKTLCSPYR